MTRRSTVIAVAAAAATALSSLATAQAAGPAFRIHASVKMLPGGGTVLRQKGTFSGAPLGRGTVDVRTRLGSRNGTHVDFVLTNARGSVRGAGDAKVTFRGTVISYSGAAKISGGTGAFADLRRSGLRFAGRGDLAGETFAVDISG